MRITSPAPNTGFAIASDTTPPRITVTTDAAGPHSWNWVITWRTWRRSGQVLTPGNVLVLDTALANLGGALTVTARAGLAQASVALKVTGTNPSATELSTYLDSRPGSGGFGAIIEHETHGNQFTREGEPVRSFDGGYGMCQLTTPIPTLEQCWNWKRNVDAGLVLFAEKRRAAIAYLSQSNRSYTDDQLRHEAVARWNGGAYHRFVGNAWVRNPDILCDPQTGNIGWDMTDPDNAGQTLAQLHARDAAAFRGGRHAGDNWRYSGVCYADALLGR